MSALLKTSHLLRCFIGADLFYYVAGFVFYMESQQLVIRWEITEIRWKDMGTKPITEEQKAREK